MNPNLPSAKSQTKSGEREKIRDFITRRNLCGLANDTKWDEFIEAMRLREGWKPSYRFKCVDGPPSEWDVEWFYHLPFPFISVEWFDVALIQETKVYRLPQQLHIVDHSPWIEELLARIGLDYTKGKKMLRIFGYSPRDLTLFDE